MNPRARATPRDLYPLALVGAVVLASLLPARGMLAAALPVLTVVAVALVLFLHGLRLSRDAMVAGATNWRLHLVVMLVTFVGFPLLGLGLRAALPDALPPPLWTGVLFLCLVPSTVQSSIAFTAIARGNVPAAICAATLSNLAGVLLTPLLAVLVLHVAGVGLGPEKALAIGAQVLLPALLGQALRPSLGGWAHRNAAILRLADRGSILLIVYAAFSAAVVAGLWHGLSSAALARLAAIDLVILAVALLATSRLGHLKCFGRADRIAIVFCGSKKSLATGAPIAGVLFGVRGAGAVILPLMLYHQFQLMACAALARRWASDPEPEPTLLARLRAV